MLDWGGTGTPIVLLAGGGNTAHVFDDFAPKLASDHHVYGITRRGFGASGFSPSENAIDRLRDDVLAVINALMLERPVIAGHSIAGVELSALANAYPDRIAGLVYLDAGYPYAFDNGRGPRMKEFQAIGPRQPNAAPSNLVSFASLQQWDAEVYGYRTPEAEFRQTWDADSSGRPRRPAAFPGSEFFAAIMTGTRTFPSIPVPALIIFASPHVREAWIAANNEPGVRDAANSYYATIDDATERQAKAIEAGVPTARIVRLRGAHYIFLSSEADTLREIRTFMAALK